MHFNALNAVRESYAISFRALRGLDAHAAEQLAELCASRHVDHLTKWAALTNPKSMGGPGYSPAEASAIVVKFSGMRL